MEDTGTHGDTETRRHGQTEKCFVWSGSVCVDTFWAQNAPKESAMGRRKPHRYSPAFKAEGLLLIAETDEPIKKIAREGGVASKTWHKWVKAARPDRGSP